jgi:predicted kinase
MLAPAELICMACGPDARLERETLGRDGEIAVLRCPRCGDRHEVPVRPLFVVAGPSGAGKSTVTSPLRALLADCDVFDADLTWHLASAGHDNWRNTWLQLAHGIALNGRATVLCGSLTPDQLERQPFRKAIGPIHFCLLDCSDDVRAARLRARPDHRDSSSDETIIRHQRYAAWLRERISPCFDTSVVAPEETAAEVAAWITGKLSRR